MTLFDLIYWFLFIQQSLLTLTPWCANKPNRQMMITFLKTSTSCQLKFEETRWGMKHVEQKEYKNFKTKARREIITMN